ncbi:MAG: diacylglycerol/lipid kinase family protein, partial [Reyranellales bacterium]
DTAAAGDARRLAETCDAARYAVIAVAGGDGTINEVVNGLARRGSDGPALAIVPLGTANVLAHELGLKISAAAIAGAILAGRELSVRPGAASGEGPARHFSLMAGAGFDAHVVAGVSSALKRRWGKLAYVWRSLVESLHYRPVRYVVEIDGVRHEAASVIVTRGRHYAGPYVVAPDAALGEPTLHVCLFERWGRLQPLRFGAALVLGRLPGAAGYRVVAGRNVRISVAGEEAREPLQIDGDDALSLPVSIALASGAVRMLRPA